MQELYRLRASSTGITKLEALRAAQLGLLRGDVKPNPMQGPDRGIITSRPSSDAPSFPRSANASYAHPYYWAPFFFNA
jgi:CHAT domain-containing protein